MKHNNIYLVWFAYQNPSLEIYLKSLITNVYALKVESLYEKDLPPQSYNNIRKQYLTEPFLKILSKYFWKKSYALGIANVDLYVNNFNFVFGQADFDKEVAIIGLARLDETFYGKKPNEQLFLKRAGKEAIHEIGHILGLLHCKNRKCVMYFSNSLRDTDIKEDKLCSSCYKRLK